MIKTSRWTGTRAGNDSTLFSVFSVSLQLVFVQISVTNLNKGASSYLLKTVLTPLDKGLLTSPNKLAYKGPISASKSE